MKKMSCIKSPSPIIGAFAVTFPFLNIFIYLLLILIMHLFVFVFYFTLFYF